MEIFKHNCKMDLSWLKGILLPVHPQEQVPAGGLPVSSLTAAGARGLKMTEDIRYLQSRHLFF
jgi:hypothetical protein